jgi:hypothetical protein
MRPQHRVKIDGAGGTAGGKTAGTAAAGGASVNIVKRGLLAVLIWSQCVLIAPLPVLAQNAPSGPEPSPAELQQMVAPIALYPDALVAQILAASTYPTQVVEANRWLRNNSALRGDQLAAAASEQPWDPSVKALTAFPSVLDNMDKNLSWTSALGDAYYNAPQDVLNAIQVLRRQAQQAGTLRTTSQQRVVVEGSTVIIEPANPQVVYVPAYNPTTAYGAPVAAYPGYSGADLALTGVLAFGAGVLVGSLVSSDGWGWNHWNTDWHGGNVVYNKNVYVSNTNVYQRNSGWNGNWNRGGYRNTTVNVQNRENNFENRNFNRQTFSNQSRNFNNQNFEQQNRNFGRQNRNLASKSPAQPRPAGRQAGVSNWSNNLTHANRESRGYGSQSASQRRSAFAGISPGGNAFANSQRGRASFANAQRYRSRR